jgi:hypothetical protein
MAKLIDLNGKRFGRLLVLSYSGSGRWLCKCVCGTEKVVYGGNLVAGYTQSCGCLHKEIASKICAKVNYKHGHARDNLTTKEYNVWSSMIKRCYNENSKYYGHYGARGIKVCDRWLKSFENFYEDMGPCPKGMSIERIDNNGYYSPGNCKWATSKEQARNRRTNFWIEHEGNSMILKDWAKFFGVSGCIISYHFRKGRSISEMAEIFRNSKQVRHKQIFLYSSDMK